MGPTLGRRKLRPKFRKRKGKNLSETKRQGLRDSTILLSRGMDKAEGSSR